MHLITRFFLIYGLFFAAVNFTLTTPQWALAASVSVSERNTELQRVYRGLTLRARTQRHTQGALLLGSGALLATSGYILLKDNQKHRDLGFGFSGVGAAVLASGLHGFLWESETETIAQVFNLVSADDVSSKVTTGEALLKTMAQRARTQRVILGGSSSLLGGGALAIALTSQAPQKERVTAGIAGAGLLAAGLWELFIPEDEEMALQEYEDFLEKKPQALKKIPSTFVSPYLVYLNQNSTKQNESKATIGAGLQVTYLLNNHQVFP